MGKPVLLVEALAAHNDSGLGKLVRMFVDALRGLENEADIRVIVPRGAAYRPGPHCRTLLVNPSPLRPWIQTILPWILFRNKPRAVFHLGQTLPLLRPSARHALLIPDAGPLEDSPWPMSSHDAYNRRWLAAHAPRADLIVTNAAFTRDRLKALLGVPQEKIAVVKPIARELPETASTSQVTRAAQAAPAAIVKEAASAPSGEYFLAFGNVEPRKNYPGLLAAYARLRSRRPDAPPLYIVGHKAWGWTEAEAALSRLGLREQVRFMGYLPVTLLQAYLRGCTAFVSASLYEGWGLPLFEALAAGKPALYHRDSSQDEFARGLALAVDCGDEAGFADGLEKLLDPRERLRLAESARAGMARVQAYDLEEALRAVLLPLLEG
jgi:glycosyltransferase involved in cell wall biosynthesis